MKEKNDISKKQDYIDTKKLQVFSMKIIHLIKDKFVHIIHIEEEKNNQKNMA